jgi:hypothetical protein
MNYYLVEFVDDSVHSQYEEVSAISAEDAVHSIKLGWPNAKIWNVWTETGENDQWKDDEIKDKK